MKTKNCEIKKCLLADREEDISQYIDDEINASEAVDKMNAGLAAIE